jgi:hypothetical protein
MCPQKIGPVGSEFAAEAEEKMSSRQRAAASQVFYLIGPLKALLRLC